MKKFIAFVIDFILAFGVVGYILGLVFGMTTENGFMLTGFPMLIMIGWLVFYFWGMRKMGKKTVGKMILKLE